MTHPIPPLIAIDVETGGLDIRRHGLLSLAAVKARPEGEIADFFHRYIWPEPDDEIDPEAARINGYSPEAWEKKGAVTLRTALADFAQWLREHDDRGIYVAHNAGFDRSFLETACEKARMSCLIGYRWRCSMAALAFARDCGVLPPGECSLDALIEVSGQTPRGRGDVHHALFDAKASLTGYRWLCRHMPCRDAATATPAPASHE